MKKLIKLIKFVGTVYIYRKAAGKVEQNTSKKSNDKYDVTKVQQIPTCNTI